MNKMMRRTLGMGLLAGAATICGATASTPAIADLSPIYNLRPVATCANAPADATLNWGANQATIGASSPNVNYSHPNCEAWIVDINVSSATASAPSGYASGVTFSGDDPERDNGGMTSYVPQADCAKYVEQVQIFKKGPGGFTQVGGGYARGVWYGSGTLFNGCVLTPEYGGFGPWSYSVTPPSSGTETYRVVTSTHLGTTRAHARGFGTHMMQPPPLQ
jgi:hypothetical protein